MRSNGLTAAAYTPVADLDARLADALLEELKARGVAAYTSPAETSSTAGFERPEFRVDVKERLYVDTARAAQVRDLISRQDPSLVTENDDLTWAQIVAGFDQPVDTSVVHWPKTEDLDEPDTLEGELGDDWGQREPKPVELTWPDPPVAAPEPRASYGEERFVPPPPPPLPQLEPHKQIAWLGVVGGPLLLMIAALFSVALPEWVSLLAVGAFVGGFVTLVVTMENRDGEDGSDDGAVV